MHGATTLSASAPAAKSGSTRESPSAAVKSRASYSGRLLRVADECVVHRLDAVVIPSIHREFRGDGSLLRRRGNRFLLRRGVPRHRAALALADGVRRLLLLLLLLLDGCIFVRLVGAPEGTFVRGAVLVARLPPGVVRVPRHGSVRVDPRLLPREFRRVVGRLRRFRQGRFVLERPPGFGFGFDALRPDRPWDRPTARKRLRWTRRARRRCSRCARGAPMAARRAQGAQVHGRTNRPRSSAIVRDGPVASAKRSARAFGVDARCASSEASYSSRVIPNARPSRRAAPPAMSRRHRRERQVPRHGSVPLVRVLHRRLAEIRQRFGARAIAVDDGSEASPAAICGPRRRRGVRHLDGILRVPRVIRRFRRESIGSSVIAASYDSSSNVTGVGAAGDPSS